MESKRGAAMRVTHSTTVRGGSAGGGTPLRVFTEHVCTFEIRNGLVRACSSEPLVIRDGDEVIAVGSTRRDGIFAARAYANLTAGVRGGYINSRAYRGMGMVAIAIPLLAAALYVETHGRLFEPLTKLLSDEGLALLGVPGVGLFILGTLLIREAALGEEANNLCKGVKA